LKGGQAIQKAQAALALSLLFPAVALGDPTASTGDKRGPSTKRWHGGIEWRPQGFLACHLIDDADAGAVPIMKTVMTALSKKQR
jgi:hypothetical protein